MSMRCKHACVFSVGAYVVCDRARACVRRMYVCLHVYLSLDELLADMTQVAVKALESVCPCLE